MTGILLHRLQKEGSNQYQLLFDLKNGNSIDPKIVAKLSGNWQELQSEIVKKTTITKGEKLC